ncbi:AraC family transcriptional regulator [Sphingomonas sp. VL_57B]|jgi:AraC-like DNA-binding protein|uniref:helix-turn-helix transcriptional regulator n=2 Tax=Sphingomonas TaxID=13687 RepID=UPI0029EA72A5|nr:helix-turn-helix transcriptional regulator [Pseudomonadota bacterium]
MARGHAKLAMAQGLSVWVLDAPEGFGDAGFHAHHAIQITIALSGDLMLDCAGIRRRGPALAVNADACHRFEARGLLAFVFVEPESRTGRALRHALFQEAPLVVLDPAKVGAAAMALRETFAAALERAVLLEAGYGIVEAIVPRAEAPLPDPRILRMIAHAAGHLDEPLTLASASADIPLSPSRLRHLFVEQTGLAFKTYVLWLRLFRAVQGYSEGLSLTEAAHAAGFADSAHFSRVFKRTFGLPATTLTRL